jgi:hypothetical protein
MPQRQKQYSRLIHLVLHPRGDSESGAIGNLIFIAGLAFYQKMITVVPSQNLNPNVLMMKRARVALQARSWMVMEKPKLPGNGRFRSNNRDRRFESILLRQRVLVSGDTRQLHAASVAMETIVRLRPGSRLPESPITGANR